MPQTIEKARTVLRGDRDNLRALIRRLSDTLTLRGQRVFRSAVFDAVTGDATLGWENLSIHIDELFDIYEVAYKRAGRIESAILGQFEIDLQNPRVVRYLRERSATLVTRIDDQSRDAIRIVLSRGAANGLEPEQLVTRIRRIVGLTPRDATAVENLRRGLKGQGINPARAERIVEAYSKRLLDARALVIARTEVTDAIESARQEVWEQAVLAGLVLRKDIWRVWVTAEDELVCPVCKPLDGARSRLGGVFKKGGQTSPRPPAHPNCRCEVDYEIKGLRVQKHGQGSHDEKDHGNWARGLSDEQWIKSEAKRYGFVGEVVVEIGGTDKYVHGVTRGRTIKLSGKGGGPSYSPETQTPHGIAVHEFGHLLWNAAESKYGKDFTEAWIDQASLGVDLIDDRTHIRDFTHKGQTLVRSQLKSSYALRSHGEMFAEAYAVGRLRINPPSLARGAVEFIRVWLEVEFIEKHGGGSHDDKSHGNWARKYRGQHQPSGSFGAPAHDLGAIMGNSDDIYDHPEWFFSMREAHNRAAARLLRSVRGKPDQNIKIYRAVPVGIDSINPGDWVTPISSVAQLHGEASMGGTWDRDGEWIPNPFIVLVKSVKVRELVWPGDSLVEFGWFPDSDLAKHYGPGPHPGTGTDQSVHGRGRDGSVPGSGDVPDTYEPGERPLPEGTVRLYHYTQKMGVVDTIAREGLKVGSARGSTYGEPNAIWFSTEIPQLHAKEFVEIALPLEMLDRATTGGLWFGRDGKRKGIGDISFGFDIGVEHFIAIHKPWHSHYRFMRSDGGNIKELKADPTALDFLLDDPEYGPAVRLIKDEIREGIHKHRADHDEKTHGNWARDMRVGAPQRKSSFVRPDGNPMVRDGIGDTYEDLLLSVGLPPQNVISFTNTPTHMSGVGQREFPIDVVIGQFNIEVKTVNSNSQRWKSTMKKSEVLRKYAQAEADMKRPATLIQIVHQDLNRVDVHFFPDEYASKSVNRRTPDYSYTYEDSDFWTSYERQGYGGRR